MHPTHEIYTDFDPKRSLSPGENWTFTFTHAGRWRYHDHLSASSGGLVVVVEKGVSSIREPKKLRDCEPVPSDLKQQCWDDLLAYTLREKGLERAFDLFADLYATDPDIPKECHGWGHLLGSEAYRLYRLDKQTELPEETSYCGYGFYHGFLETLITDTGSPDKALAFCQSLRARGEKEDLYRNCIHGIGHGGAADLIESPDMYGKLQEAINRGGSLCRDLTSTPTELRECTDGVFNELVLDLFYGKYGLVWDEYVEEQDPLALCRKQDVSLRTSCYFEFMGPFENLFRGDFLKAASYVISAIPEQTNETIAIRKLSADFMQSEIVEDEYYSHVQTCRTLPTYALEPCLGGIHIGLLAHGEPRREYERGLAFCASALLLKEEASTCYRWMEEHLAVRYEKALFKKACASIPTDSQTSLCKTL